jgi:RNA polymerase sigma factor (sigma-70 family)
MVRKYGPQQGRLSMTYQAATAETVRSTPTSEALLEPSARAAIDQDASVEPKDQNDDAPAEPDRTTAWQDSFAAARRGDGQAYARFLRDIVPVIRGIVRAKAGGLGGAVEEDIVQDVLLAIHDKRHTWREDEPVQPWLYAITRYKVVDAFRRRGRSASVPIEDMADTLPAPEEADPTERADAMRVIGRLEPASAELVLAIVRQGASIRDLAQRFGITEGAVRVRLHRATRRLGQLRRTMIE